ncbi:hypothetical protein [Streptomyces peucetius]|uniref:Cellulose synthase n=1 Tax=Streptomyces peucetius TaxID=1950 RepID=A0ABY6I2B2_STRPE|nr:hypothetical protein [Streptomyces peucetius]UYQ61128.1 hypothetical protein OGH68_06360 [Streptomyces peucetius]
MLAETICSAVSAAGLGIAAITAYRRRFLAAARIAAYSLVPVGLVMTGAVDWAVSTAFSPTAWVGFGLLGGAWLLFITTRAVERRRAGGSRKERKAAAAAARGDTVEPAASRPSLGGSAPAAEAPKAAEASKAARPKASAADDDFSDIEAILKKHGI